MAHRDRSAGHAFMYVDIQNLLQQTREIKKASEAGSPVETQSQNTHQFNPDSGIQASDSSVKQIQGNLERLQSLHHKLHAMLEELNKITGKK